jgi:8-oxo-dGTP pyrophosphatase MutT (NUDIX family)
MYITIHFGDKPVILSDDKDPYIKELLKRPDTFTLDEGSEESVQTLLEELKKPDISTGVIISIDLPGLKELFWSNFQVMTAAGGMVVNEQEQYLFIHRRGHWDLPKGKLDEGETIEECALREIREETGLQELEIIKSLLITYHTYHMQGKDILKESYWYLVSGSVMDTLVPQTEEDIEKIIWVDRTEVAALLSGAYPSIREVVAAEDIS